MIRKKSSIVLCLVAGIIVIGISMGMYSEKNDTAKQSNIKHELANKDLSEKVLIIGNNVLRVEIAETPEQQVTGLSHRASLAEGQGMLFVFNNDGTHGIWMKDMHFPIDIVWINAAMKVVHIEQAVTQDTYPQTFAPPVPARYVLETSAGYTTSRIQVGDIVTLRE